MPCGCAVRGRRLETGIRARGATPALLSPRSSSQLRRAPATTAIRTSLTVPPTVLRTRCTSSRSRTTPAIWRVPVGGEVRAGEERAPRVARATSCHVEGAAQVGEGSADEVGQFADVRQSAGRLRGGARAGLGQVQWVHQGGGEHQCPQTVGQRVVELEEHGDEVPSSPGRTCASHGWPRWSGRSMSRPAAAGVWRSARAAGRGREARKSGAGSRAALPAGREGEGLPDVADPHAAARAPRPRGPRAVRRRARPRLASARRRHRGRRGASGAGRTRCSRTPGRVVRGDQESKACSRFDDRVSKQSNPDRRLRSSTDQLRSVNRHIKSRPREGAGHKGHVRSD